MSGVDKENDDVTENPHPEDEADSDLPEGAEGQDQTEDRAEGQEKSEEESEDSIEEGTEAELEAEDEAGAHQVVPRLLGFAGNQDEKIHPEAGEEADSDSETEDFIMPTAEGASLVEGQQNRNYEGKGDNLNEEVVLDNPSGANGIAGIATNHQQCSLSCDLAEADVGVINANSNLEDRDTETESDRHQGNNFGAENSPVVGSAGDSVEADTAPDEVSESVEADSGMPSGNECISNHGLPESSVLNTEQSKLTDACGGVDDESDESVSERKNLTEDASNIILEDELGSVHDKQLLNVKKKLQRGESGESWEPECDQDSDEIRGSAELFDSDSQPNISQSHMKQGQSSTCEIPKPVVTLDGEVQQGAVETSNHQYSSVCLQNQHSSQSGDHSNTSPNSVSNVSEIPVSGDCIASKKEGDISHCDTSKGINSVSASIVNTDSANTVTNNSERNIDEKHSSEDSSACQTHSDKNCSGISTNGVDEQTHEGGNLKQENIKGDDSMTNSEYKNSDISLSESKLSDEAKQQNCDMVKQCLSSPGDMVDDDLLDELESELTNQNPERLPISAIDPDLTLPLDDESGDATPTGHRSPVPPNGFVDVGIHSKLVQKLQALQQEIKRTKANLQKEQQESRRWKSHAEDCEDQMSTAIKERDSYLHELKAAKEHNADELYIPQIKELEFTIAQQQNEVRGLRDKLASHDAAAKKCIAGLQTEMKHRVDQVTKMYEEANKDKADMVVKYAQAEKNFMGAHKAVERLEVKVREMTRERDSLNNKVKEAKGERKRLQTEIDTKTSEVNSIAKELEKEKDLLVSADVRIRWAQNKLKAELESHKETKVVLDKTHQKLKEAKEETEQIRQNCQEIVKTYQESEEIKSNNLDNKLKMKESELLHQQQQKSSQEEAYQAACQEIEQLKGKQMELVTDLGTFRDKCTHMEAELQQNEETMNKYTAMLQKQKKDNKDLQTRIEHLVPLQSDLKRAQTTIKSLDAEIAELKISNKDLKIESEACYRRETEKLELTEKLSAKNAELQSENTLLQNKSLSLSSEVQSLRIEVQSQEAKVKQLTIDLEEEQRLRQGEVTHLTTSLAEKTKAAEEMARRIEDEKDEIKTLKRKHTNNVKDLTRQLQQAKKRLEAVEMNGERDTTSMGSRTSSNGSLNTMADTQNGPSQGVPAVRHYSPQEQEYPVITEQVEPDRQLLIERIVKLQRSHARKNEKIEFMDDHISQLIDEIHRKNKIIQSYALREEAGTLTPEVMDHHKIDSRRQSIQAKISKKHSIMGSLYSSHQTDGTMTLDLSLEINKKLQAVLEDTLLKNITLKESLDTLGEEISRLSQENRQLQLSTQTRKKPAR
ncbi:LOW QUALITY PROTEIN: coiled-coil domain-containing protein 186-like [Ylistrum balloti]|uniref:LOW QUALITY PROTEIN: coiled-coil domain-containing protein 186-like n=1 Tax=Ylistrum balloti TaxID=509963 RepID=UPI002905EB58|nr:LOW QUALITY PROTEIN: coiled-coil domain-containing protein 186-like [Ylistrum balloti]